MLIAFLYSGVIPFVLTAFALIFSVVDTRYIPYIIPMQAFFATFIGMFMIGTYWGQGIGGARLMAVKCSIALTIIMLVISAVVAVFISSAYSLFLYIIMFWVLYGLDQNILSVHHSHKGYLKHRLIATGILTSSLLITILFMKGL